MSGICCGKKRQIQLGWNVSGKKVRFRLSGMCFSRKTSDSAWLDCVLVKNVKSSMAGMCFGYKR
jgi:hypothetical protein